MKRNLKYLLLTFILILVHPHNYTSDGSIIAPLYEEPSLKIEKNELSLIIEKYYKNLVSYDFNGSILAAYKGKVIFRASNGFADIPNSQPLTANHATQLASVSKQFTSAAIMMLFDKGLLSFQDTVQLYFPDFPYLGITIEMLLQHRSGLPEYFYFNDSLIASYVPLNNQKLMQFISKYKPTKYANPNTRFDYTNTNYAVLAAIVEKISGMSFPEFMQKYIFDAASLKHTFIYEPKRAKEYAQLALGHNSPKQIAEDNIFDDVFGDKGVYSTVNDLFLWDEALNSGRIVRKSTLEKAFTPPPSKKEFFKDYGYGWRLQKMPNNQTMVYHPGWWHGNNSLYVKLPHEQFSLFIISNKRTSLFLSSYRELINELFPGSFQYNMPVFENEENFEPDTVYTQNEPMVQVVDSLVN